MKSQSSVEFIIIFSLILSILLVIVIIFDPITNTSKNMNNNFEKQYLAEKEVGIVNYAFNETNGIITLKNNIDYPINITKIKISDDNINYNLPILLNPSELIRINFSQDLNIDEYYELKTYIEYKNTINQITEAFTVELKGNKFESYDFS